MDGDLRDVRPHFCDFTRNSTSTSAIRRGSFWGILPNTLFFGFVVVVLAGGQFRIDGQVISSPSDVVDTIPNTPLLLLASAALLVLTVAVNLMANFVAPCYALSNLMPTVLDFRRAGIVSAVLGLVILPWNLYDNPVVIVYFLGVLGALLGPLFGIVMADYWLVRRGRVDVPALYSEDPDGAYHYRSGVNLRAVAVFVPSAALAVVAGFVPAMEAVARSPGSSVPRSPRSERSWSPRAARTTVPCPASTSRCGPPSTDHTDPCPPEPQRKDCATCGSSSSTSTPPSRSPRRSRRRRVLSRRPGRRSSG
ncbi:cytosine permease [Pseudonocardia sp. P1]|uniref:cytosine permease n=1 Tax=Pseudonocardia sp. P1 TaxID=761194 RepID=UPI00307D982B